MQPRNLNIWSNVLSSDLYSDLIPSIYESSICPERWTDNLDRMAQLIGAGGAGLLLLETLNVYHYSISYLTSNYCSNGCVSEKMMEYQQEYSIYEKDAFSKLGESTPLSLVKDDLFETDKEAASARPDVLFLRRHYNVFERFGVRINDDREFVNGITFQYDVSRGNITNSEWRKLSPLLVHVKKSIEISRSFTILKARYNAILAALNRVEMAYAIALSCGEVIVFNEYAQTTFDKNDGISLSNDRKLNTNCRETNAEIAATIRAVSNTVSGISRSSGKLIMVPKSSKNEPLLLEISPLRDTTRELDSFLNGALITIVDPEEQSSVNTAGMKELYNLTEAESSVADMMVEGAMNQAIADTRGVSLQTVKSQVKSVLCKTGTKNRADLIRRVLSINLPVS